MRVPNTAYTIHAEWRGGAYIDLGLWEGHAVEVINVWDHRIDRPTYPYTREGLRAAIQQWINDYRAEDAPGTDSLANDMKHWSDF